MEELLKLLSDSNIKLVSRETGIPYARMHKWTQGGGKPKIDDFNILTEYFKNKKIDKSKLEKKQDHPDPTNSIEQQLSQLRSEFLKTEEMYRELIAEKDKRLAEKDVRLAEKDEVIRGLKEQLAAKRKAPTTAPDPGTLQR